jgi:hypothetical protein
MMMLKLANLSWKVAAAVLAAHIAQGWLLHALQGIAAK